jgi:toxin HigB-1
MRVSFRNRKLRSRYEQSAEAIKAYGEPVARKYIMRVNIILMAQNFDALHHMPGLDCHPLKGDRAGEWAIKLTGKYRLIITLRGDDADIVRIEEVSMHYED